MLSTHQWLLVSIATLVAWLIGRYLFSTQRPTDFPPGPATIFGLGNLHQIPIKQPYLQFHKWTGTYGDIIGLKVGPANLVVLNSSECVRELFDKRGAIYSGRPYSYIPSKHVFREHRDKHILTLQNGPYLRQFRTAVSYLVGPTGLKQTLPMQEATAATLVWKLSVTPSNFQEHLRHWALATPLLTIAGQRLEDRGKAFSDRFFDAQRKWLEILEPGSAPPVDFIPFLRWVPEMFAGWKTKARCVRKYMLDEYFSFLESAERLRSSAEKDENAGQNGAKFLCLLAKVLEEDDNENPGRKRFTADQVAYMGGGLVDAAVDTTWATLMSFIMFMAVYPDCQAKARAEIDQLSVDQPPRGDIIGQIPYVRACILETFRLRPPAPSGLPHVLDRDDTFKGYKIPKGTTLLANVWAIQRNPKEYDQPEDFIPERFLHQPQGIKVSEGVETALTEGRRLTYTFGAGRRVCPGEQFATNSLLLAVSKLLWAFEIFAPEPIDLAVETAFHDGLILSPKPFNVKFVLRDQTRGHGVARDYEESLARLGQIGI